MRKSNQGEALFLGVIYFLVDVPLDKINTTKS